MRERGSGSVEWVALLAVVGGTLAAAAGGALPHARVVPDALRASFTRAVCLVSGGDCLDGAPRPCVIRSHSLARSRRVTFAVLRLGDGRTVLREDRSDGSVVLSVQDTAAAGGEVGAQAGVTVAGRGLTAVARLAGEGRGGRGRSFVVPDAAAADRLVARLGEEGPGVRALVSGGDDALVPHERWWLAGESMDAEAKLRGAGLAPTAHADASLVVQVRERVRTGERTYVLRSDGEMAAALTAPLAGVGMSSPSHMSVELALDRRGSPASLTLRAARGVHGEAKLARWHSGGGDLVEAEARLDLADPVTRSLARSLLSRSRALPAARALAARLADRARIDVRVFETTRRESVKGASAALIAKGGYEVVEVTRTARLVAAAGREPGMGWARRLDCVGVAA